ncbi:MAG: hypothetical protein ACPG7F_21265, partial [Aggregatilineales bacterium]
IMAETLTNPELAGDIDEDIYQPLFKLAEQYFQAQMNAGNLPAGDPAMMVRVFSTPLFGLMSLRLMGDEHVSNHWEQYVAAITDMLVQMYRNQHPDNPSNL